MGRNTFEFVANYDGPWPYTKPLVVASMTLTDVPSNAVDSEIFAGSPTEIVAVAGERGWSKLYIDGGALVTSFVNLGLLDELTATVLPVALGSGVPVFGELENYAWFELASSTVINDTLVQNTYRLTR